MLLILELGLKALTKQYIEEKISLILRTALGDQNWWHPLTYFEKIESGDDSGRQWVWYRCDVDTGRGCKIVNLRFVFRPIDGSDLLEFEHLHVVCGKTQETLSRKTFFAEGPNIAAA
jgi:hypothetical protein